MVRAGGYLVLPTYCGRQEIGLTDSVPGLRDRAPIGLMVYTFSCVGAAVSMKVEDYFVQGRRGWVRLHEKGGKKHAMPTRHNLDPDLDEYIQAPTSPPTCKTEASSRSSSRWPAMNPHGPPDFTTGAPIRLPSMRSGGLLSELRPTTKGGHVGVIGKPRSRSGVGRAVGGA